MNGAQDNAAGSEFQSDPFLTKWKDFFADYSDIVMVANSEEADIEALASEFPPETLFIFFNKVYKILERPFDRPSLLACRSGMMGANVVHRREVADVVKFFDPADFRGVLNVVIGHGERFSPAPAFGGVPVQHVDLEPLLLDFYPEGRFPTTGFALCIWLRQLQLPARISLIGFSSKRSEKWKVFDVHDWTFEQVALRLFHRSGKIRLLGTPVANPYAGLAQKFPEYTETDIALTASEVLSDRHSNLSSVVDRLMSVTKILRYFDNSFRKIRPKTRKQKFLASQRDSGQPGG
jgi:hypothetical protein